jgi:hypothetical protein
MVRKMAALTTMHNRFGLGSREERSVSDRRTAVRVKTRSLSKLIFGVPEVKALLHARTHPSLLYNAANG